VTADTSRDGQWLLFVGNSGKGNLSDIWTYSFRDKQARPWLATSFFESAPALSPDGKWIAYQSDESGRNEIYVRAFPESEEKFPVSNTGGKMPAWRADGREIYYVSPDVKMMAVSVDTSHDIHSGTPAPLFDVRLLYHPNLRQYDTVDGTRFLLNRLVVDEQRFPFTLVQNWTARLKTPAQ
jgi:Tol biopolymer transport system component